MKQFINVALLMGVLSLFALTALPAHAQLVPCQMSAPTAVGQLPQCRAEHLIGIAVRIYNFLLGMMAFVAVLILVWCGIRLFIYQYEEDPDGELKSIKLTIRRALFGIVIIMCAYLLVFTLLRLLGVQSGTTGQGTLRQFLNQFGFPI